MGFLDWLRGPQPEPETHGGMAVVPWEEVLAKYDVVDVMAGPDPVVIVSERTAEHDTVQLSADVSQLPAAPMLGELGSSSPSPWVAFSRREYNTNLQGLRGLEQFDRMRKSDGVVRGTLRLIKTPPLAGRWFMQPASNSTRDVNAAKFAWRALTEFQSVSWNQLLNESLLCADFGYYMFEKVWEERVIDGQNRLIWKKLAPRHPMDVKQWVYDAQGGPNGVWMFGAGPINADSGASVGVAPTGPAWGMQTVNGQPVGYSTSLMGFEKRDVYIPIEKLVVFTFDREASNIEGISALRSAYKHWYFKEQLYKIDAIQKERHGIGVPVIKLPPGFSTEDKSFANELGRNLRTNERAHVVLPPNWELMFAKMEGHPVDALASIKMHDDAIRENILASFMANEKSQSEDKQDLFLKATRFLANTVCDTFNDYAIPELINYNFSRVGMPRLRVRRIGEQNDWRTLSFAVRNLVGANILTPDDKLEAHLREEMDFPEADPTTARKPVTPQAPGTPGAPQPGQNPQQQQQGQGKQDMRTNQVGMPRQTPPSATPPRGNGGTDKSGGK